MLWNIIYIIKNTVSDRIMKILRNSDSLSGILVVVIAIILSAVYLWVQNNRLKVSEYVHNDSDLPEEFDGYTIVQVSDLHGKSIGRKHDKMIDAITKQEPDIIVITGDLVDRRRWNIESALSFVDEAVKIAPVYFIAGNHEANSGKYDIIVEALEERGVNVLRDEAVVISQGEASFNLIGLECVGFLPSGYQRFYDLDKVSVVLEDLKEDDMFNVVLSHRPELIDLYAASEVDLVFCGHAHGGQIRIPFIGGILAPDQGLFPEYTDGMYYLGRTCMVVSRGIGNSVFPFRVNNRPELVSVKLKCPNE